MKKTTFDGETVYINKHNLVIVKRGCCFFAYEIYEEAKADDLLKMNRIYYGNYIKYSRKLKALEDVCI